MAVTEYIPGMKPGSTGRNAILGIFYLLFFPLLILAAPFVLAYQVGRNSNGLADKLQTVPGISAGGGAVSGVAAFFYLWVLLGVVGAALPGDTSTGGTPESSTTSSPAPTATDGGQSQGQSKADQQSTPTATATNTKSPEPAGTPTPSPSPSPTPTATSTPTATPSPTPAPDLESYQFSGSGSDVTGTFSTSGGLVVIELDHTGQSNFIVQAISEDGDKKKYLVNAIGTYDGRVALYLPADTWMLDIDADGSWNAHVKQPRYSTAEIQSLPASKSGQHHDYMGPFRFEGTTKVTIKAKSEDHVAVWLAQYDGEKVKLLENDVGPYESTTVIAQEGVGLIIIESDSGEWVVEIGG